MYLIRRCTITESGLDSVTKHSIKFKTIINCIEFYLNRWSGITESDLDGVTKTFSEMQDDLLKLFNDKTVLVGHCISSDLIACKVSQGYYKISKTLVSLTIERKSLKMDIFVLQCI